MLALGAGVGVALAELTGSGDGSHSTRAAAPAPRAAGPTASSTARRSFLSRVIPPPAGSISGARPPAQIARLVRSLPLERKIAGLMIVGFRGTDTTGPIFGQLRRYDWGGLMVAGQNFTGSAQLSTLTAELQAQVARVGHVQPLLMVVQQGAEFSALRSLPPDVAPGETDNVSQAATVAGKTARTFKRLGLNAIFAPSLEVGAPDESAMGVRAYSDEPAQVAAYAQGTIESYRHAGILPAAGRFPGLGAAAMAPEDGPPNVGLSLDELRLRDLVPWRAAIRAGVPAVVIGHGLYVTDDFVVAASQSSAIATQLLRGQLGFRGVSIADDLTQAAITRSMATPDAALASISAGVDMVYVPGPDSLVRATYDTLLSAAKRGKLPRARIDEALTRALVAKSDLGLLRRRPKPPPATPSAP
ncbi:MAG: beta-N-acetylhexosaminidase [Thermoleophilaceae bacterium]|nr:beta-N-acetylhexosaminidase [Thermoleophilaceae bacterium]